MSNFDKLTPSSIKDGNHHSTVSKGWWWTVSSVLGFFFVFGVTCSAIIKHWYQIAVGIETKKAKDNSTPIFTPRKPYKDMKAIRATDDLRYYALQIDLDLELYKIKTADNYILTLHHLVDPKESAEQRALKEPIILQHGLLSCSGAYLTSGYNSLAYYFLEQGYDVWMGNNRSWFEVNHATLDGDLMHSEDYWDWDMRHLAYYDLPCIIDHVLSHKPNHTQAVLAGHSQGLCQSFLMLKNGNLAAYHKKIKMFVALAPAVFPGSLFHHKSFLRFVFHLSRPLYKAFFGIYSFLPVLTDARAMLVRTKLFGWISYVMFKYLFGWNGSKWGADHTQWHIHFIFNVTFVSSKLMSWWLSQWVEDGFSNQLLPKKAYMSEDHCNFTPVNSAQQAREAEEASIIAHQEAEAELPVNEELVDDSKTFFPYKQRWFGLNEHFTTVPMLIFIGKLDFLVDGERLATHMRHYERGTYLEGDNLKIVELDDHSHVDVVWSEDCIGRIGYVVHEEIEKLNQKLSLPSMSPTLNEKTTTLNEKTTFNEKTNGTEKIFPSPIIPEERMAAGVIEIGA